MFAQGARRLNNALSACTVPFTFGKYRLYEGRSAYTVQSAEIAVYFQEIAEDYDVLCHASYFAEMVQHFTRENLEAGEELKLLYITMRALTAGKVELRLMRVVFEWKLMQIQGESLEVFRCLGCGKEEGDNVFLQQGGIFCEECLHKGLSKQEKPIRLSRDAKYTLQYILSSSLERLYMFRVSEPVLKELEEFMKRYLKQYLPVEFKSKQFIL